LINDQEVLGEVKPVLMIRIRAVELKKEKKRREVTGGEEFA